MGLKQLCKRIYCMENKPCGAGLRPPRTTWLEEASGGRTEISPLKLDTRAAARLSACSRAAWKLWLRLIELLQKRSQPLTSGRALNIEPILSQISEETLESLKLASVIMSQRSQPTTEGQSLKRVRRWHISSQSAGGSLRPRGDREGNTRSAVKLNLKKVIKQFSIILPETGWINFKSKYRQVLCLWLPQEKFQQLAKEC